MFPLWFINTRGIGGAETNMLEALLQGAIAAAAIVFLAPVIIRGDWIQRVLAVLLLVLPVFNLLGAFLLAVGYI